MIVVPRRQKCLYADPYSSWLQAEYIHPGAVCNSSASGAQKAKSSEVNRRLRSSDSSTRAAVCCVRDARWYWLVDLRYFLKHCHGTDPPKWKRGCCELTSNMSLLDTERRLAYLASGAAVHTVRTTDCIIYGTAAVLARRLVVRA
uniref:Putative epithelin/granulin n=1 Tax=Ixodes ricinus TaxID=34613 RepID=A0A0K8RHV6_IXORI